MNHAEDEAERLAIKYADDGAEVSAILLRAHNLPTRCESDDEVKLFVPLVVELRDHAARLEKMRVAEKEPHLRRGNAVDQFFKSMTDRLGKGRSILEARVNDWNQRKLAAERARREAEERERREQARIAEEARLKAEREKRDAELAASRARTEANRVAREAEAAEATERAQRAARAAQAATQAATDARIEAGMKPGDMVRQRLDDSGTLNTMKQVPFIEIVDRNGLDKDALWPFLKDEHILMALKAWAKTNAYRMPMEGAVIEMRDATVIR